MVKRIDQDYQRFRKIIRGTIKKNLRKFMSTGEMIGKKGKDFVSIPLPQIDIPRFKYGSGSEGGVGQGEGEPGTPLGPADEPGQGQGAGEIPGEHVLEVDITLEELAEILGEELELPRIEPRGKKNIFSVRDKYTKIRRVGIESLCHFKRTYKEALKRQIMSGEYNPDDPNIIPIRPDKRYRSWKTTFMPEAAAVIIYMMDVSGSMGDEQKEIVRIEAFWLDTWLRSQYDKLDVRYITHDAEAREVDPHTFYHTRESGGTKISSAYRKALEIVNAQYSPREWNVYYFHFSDGDNWSSGDTNECVQLLNEEILSGANLFCYGQVKSMYGSGQFIKDLEGAFEKSENLITSEINDKDDVYKSIKDFLGKGK
jgi:sporulation protein YhbH